MVRIRIRVKIKVRCRVVVRFTISVTSVGVTGTVVIGMVFRVNVRFPQLIQWKSGTGKKEGSG